MHDRSSEPRDQRRRGFAVKKRPKQARARITFNAVVEAAARVLANEGYAALTTDRLASVAGVSVGSVYEYFPDKDTIVAEVVRRLLDELIRELTACSESAAVSGGAEAWLRVWLAAMFEAVGKRRELLRTLHHEVAFLDEIPEVHELPARLLALATESPYMTHALSGADPASMFLVTLLVRSAVLEAVISPPPGVPAPQIEDALARMLVTLLASCPSEPGHAGAADLGSPPASS